MTEERFEELVNLYLDREIDAVGFKELSAEVATSPERKDKLVQAYRIHRALIVASESSEHPLAKSPLKPTGQLRLPPGGLRTTVNFAAASVVMVAVTMGALLLGLSFALDPFPGEDTSGRGSGVSPVAGLVESEAELNPYRYAAVQARERQRAQAMVRANRIENAPDFRTASQEVWIDERFLRSSQEQDRSRRAVEPFSSGISWESRPPKPQTDRFRAALVDYERRNR